MKILAIHNFHRTGSASGDDLVFKNETKLLEEHGNEVIRYTVSNDEYDSAGVLQKLRFTVGMLWSWKYYREVQRIIRQQHPDIVHIHTFFPLLSPSILYAAKKCRVPVIATLHDTRFVCPCATSLRNGHLCNECGDGKYFRMFKYRCFKGSRLQSFWVSRVFDYHRKKQTFYEQIDKYICLNNEQIKLLESIGFEEAKIVKKYNFIPDPISLQNTNDLQTFPKRYVVFYGRIGEEKGVRIIMKAWNELDIPLVVMGWGPVADEFKAWSDRHSQVTSLGYTQHEKCLEIVRHSEFVVFPSIWYEGCSMVEIETMSLGKGIIATDIGFSSEAIKDGVNGYKFPLGDVEKFKESIERLWNDPKKCKKLGQNARAEYEKKYMPEENYKQLMSIYEDVNA